MFSPFLLATATTSDWTLTTDWRFLAALVGIVGLIMIVTIIFPFVVLVWQGCFVNFDQELAGKAGKTRTEPKATPQRNTVEVSKVVATSDSNIEFAGDRSRQDEILGLVYSTKPDHSDNLQDISGIGPVIERKLNEFGVYTFAQIASWSDDAAKEFATRLNFPDRIFREQWREQAKELESNRVK